MLFGPEYVDLFNDGFRVPTDDDNWDSALFIETATLRTIAPSP
jgi:hypothetical protein